MPATSSKKSSQNEFRGSLARTVILWIILLALVPVSAVSAVSYLRMREMLQDQVTNQLQVVVAEHSQDYETFASNRREALQNILGSTQFARLLGETIKRDQSGNTAERERLRTYLQTAQETASEQLFTSLLVADTQGNVLLSTQPDQERFSFRYSGLSGLVGSNQSVVRYNPAPLVTNDLVLFTTQVYNLPDNPQTYTVVGLTQTQFPQTLLSQAERFFVASNAYLFTYNDTVIGLNKTGSLALYPNHQEQITALRAFNGQSGVKEYNSQNSIPVMGFARWLPELNIGLVIEVPVSVIFDQLHFMGPFLLLILLGGVLTTSVFVSLSMRQLITPLTQLANNVQHFARGEWDRRAVMKRRDEIGLLAFSFNQMAEELSKLYHSLETKVEERNRQLSTAADVAQVVNSTTERSKILRQTVDLICERFNLDFAGIYLLDDHADFITTSETGGRLREQDHRAGMKSRIRTQSLFGKVIANRQAMVVDIRDEEEDLRPETVLPDARSCLVLPIISGNQLLGLLEAQSSQNMTFPPEAVVIFKMLANQVGNGLQNAQLVENTQIDLRETTLLYTASRKVSQSRNPLEVERTLTETVSQTGYVGVMMACFDDQYLVTSILDPLATTADKTLPRIALTDQHILDALAGKSYAIIDALNMPGEVFSLTAHFSRMGCRSLALVPVFSGGKIEFIMALGSRATAVITQTAIGPYISLAEVAANTLDRLRAMATLEQNLSDLQVMAVIGQAISTASNLDEVFTLLHEQINEASGGVVDFVVALYDHATNMIEAPYIVENQQRISVDPFPMGEGLTSLLIRTKRPLLLGQNAQAEAERLGAKMIGEPVKSWLGVPLLVANEVIGAMIVQDTQTEGRFTEKDLQLYTTFAPQVAVTVRNAQLLAKMQAALQSYDQEHFLLNSFLDTIPSMVVFKSLAGRYLRVSRVAAAEHGFEQPRMMEGKTDLELPASRFLSTQEIEQLVIASGEAQKEVVEKVSEPGGGDRWWLTSRVPIRAGGDIIGLMGISQDITTLKQTEAVSERRANLLRIAGEVASDVSETLDIDELLSRMVYRIRDRFGFYHASVFLNDPLNEYVVLRESTGQAGENLKQSGHRLAVGSKSMVGTCASQGSPIVASDVAQAPNYFPNPELPETRSELSIPLIAGEKTIGVIDVQSSQVGAFHEEDIHILQMLANQLAIAIVNADLFAKTQENITKHRFLHQITTAAAGAGSPEEALKAAVEGLLTGLGCNRVAVYLPDPRGYLEIQAAAGYEQEDLNPLRAALGEGMIGLVALGRQPLLIRDRLSEPRYAQTDSGMRSAIAVPITYGDMAAGVLCIESQRPAAFDENDQELLASLGNNLGAILANAQLITQVRRQVEQQQKVFEISNKIRRSTNVKTILETSARELAQAIKARRAQIEITTGEQRSGLEQDLSRLNLFERESER